MRRNRSTAIVLALLTLVILTACQRTAYRITYDGYGVIDKIESAYPGETVMLKVGLVFDKITDVYVNGEKIRQVNGPDEDFLYFAFEMPYEDVTVRVESRNISGADD